MFSWWTPHPVVLKGITKVPNQKVAWQPKCFSFFHSSSFSDGLVQICVTLSSAPAHQVLFAGLKCREAVGTAHWRAMASLVTPFFFFTCTHAHKSLGNGMLLLRKIAEFGIGTDMHTMLFKVPIMLCSNSQFHTNLCNIWTNYAWLIPILLWILH